MDLAREWTAFGGASLALMGLVICAGARRHAADQLDWQRQWRRAAGLPDEAERDGRGLVRAYRAGGAFGAACGLGFVAAAAAGRALTSRFGPGDARGLGLSIAALGACFAGLGVYRRSARGPRFLAFDPLAAPGARPLGERVASAAGVALCALWIWFGLRLLSEAPR